jgi:hypothetical protein
MAEMFPHAPRALPRAHHAHVRVPARAAERVRARGRAEALRASGGTAAGRGARRAGRGRERKVGSTASLSCCAPQAQPTPLQG